MYFVDSSESVSGIQTYYSDWKHSLSFREMWVSILTTLFTRSPSFLSISFYLYKTGVIIWFNLQFKIIHQGPNTFCQCQTGKLKKKKSLPLHLLFLMVVLFSLIFPGLHYCLWFTVLEWTKFLEFLLGLFFLFQYVPCPWISEYMWEFSQFRMCLLQPCIKRLDRKKS